MLGEKIVGVALSPILSTLSLCMHASTVVHTALAAALWLQGLHYSGQLFKDHYVCVCVCVCVCLKHSHYYANV